MTQLRQDQTLQSDLYDDTLAFGAALETQADIEGDLNGARSQLKRILGTTDWFSDVPFALGLKGVNDLLLAYRTPFDTTKKFTLGSTLGVVKVTSSMLAALAGDGGTRKIAVGGTSTTVGGYVAASSAGFTVGTPAAGTEVASDVNGRLLNVVRIQKDGSNDPPLDANTEVFGLLQSATGVADGATVAAGPGGENLQISFVKILPATDVITSVTLPAGTYQFSPIGLVNFGVLPRGAFLSDSGPLPDVIDPSTAKNFTKNVLHVTATIAADTAISLNGPTTDVTYVSGYDAHPSIATSGAFLTDWFVYRNGVLQEHGSAETTPAGNDVYYDTSTTIKFNKALKSGDIITIVGPTA